MSVSRLTTIPLGPTPQTQSTSAAPHHPHSHNQITTSFSPSTVSNSSLPHRNDETAATFIPHFQRPSPFPALQPQTLISESLTDDPAISLWVPSEVDSNRDLNSIREDILVRLIDRMEAIEKRLDSSPIPKEEIGPEAASEKTENTKWWSEFWQGLLVCLFAILFLGWFGAVIVLTAQAKRGGGKESN